MFVLLGCRNTGQVRQLSLSQARPDRSKLSASRATRKFPEVRKYPNSLVRPMPRSHPPLAYLPRRQGGTTGILVTGAARNPGVHRLRSQ